MSTNPLNFRDAGEWAGMWWRPDEPEHQVPGTLRYTTDDGLRLTLIGTLEDPNMSALGDGVVAPSEGRRFWDIILGVAEHKEITLLDCLHKTKQRYGARVSSPDKQIVSATYALIGKHVSNENEKAFSCCKVSVENLGQWAARSVFKTTFNLSPDGRPNGHGTMTLTPVEEPSVEVGGAEWTLAHCETLPKLSRRQGGTVGRASETAFVRITPHQQCSLSMATQFSRLIQDLISLATHRAAGIIWLQLEVFLPVLDDASGIVHPNQSVDVIYKPTQVGDYDGKAVEQNLIFFTCDHIPFAEIIPRWNEVHERLQAASNMILGLRYAPARYLENNLLTAVGAAEVLHRGLKIDTPPIPACEFKTIRDEILERVPAEYLEWFKRTLRNEPTLRDRLSVLATRPDAEAISSLVPDVDRWAEVTTRARNDLAHEGRTPRQSIDDLVAVVNVTTAVVIFNLLNELGVSAERQREIVKNHPQLCETCRQAQKCLSTTRADC